MSEPENQLPSEWEMLWNDPVFNQDFNKFNEKLKRESGSSAYNNLQGFLPNTKRGTANYFSEEHICQVINRNETDLFI